MFKKLAVMIFISILSAKSYSSSSVICSGKIKNVWVQANGLLVISSTWHNQPVGLCSLTNEINGIKQNVCKAWLSTALTAQTTHSKTQIQYYIANSTCSDIKTYSDSQAPHYFMIVGE